MSIIKYTQSKIVIPINIIHVNPSLGMNMYRIANANIAMTTTKSTPRNPVKSMDVCNEKIVKTKTSSMQILRAKNI